MYCPQCGTDSASGQQYCRSCGANLKVIGKAVMLSEAIARSDRGPLPKIKEMMKHQQARFQDHLKLEQTTEEISRALDQMNKEIAHTAPDSRPATPWWACLKQKTPEQRREKHIVNGTISLFSGVGLMIFLYNFCAALVLKVPPEWLVKIPFELEPVVRMFWLIGFIPVLSGAGHIVAGLLIRPAPAKSVDKAIRSAGDTDPQPTLQASPGSITDRTTALLSQETPASQTNEFEN